MILFFVANLHTEMLFVHIFCLYLSNLVPCCERSSTNKRTKRARHFSMQPLRLQVMEPCSVNGLYILITETDEQWVPKELLDDPDACMQYMHKQLEDGIIMQCIGSAFGQWYLYDNVHVFSSHVVFMLLFPTEILYFVLHILVKDIGNVLFELCRTQRILKNIVNS